MSVARWRPPSDKVVEEFTNYCKLIHNLSTKLRARLGALLRGDPDSWQGLAAIAERLPNILHLYGKTTKTPEISNHLHSSRCEWWGSRVWHHRLATLYLINQIVSSVLVHCMESSAHQASIIKLVVFFNQLLSMNIACKPRGVTVVKNTCPSLLQPFRRLSTTKILQILAQQRAEECGHLFVSLLLDLYQNTGLANSEEETASIVSDDIPSQDNSSMEIYRTLTRYMTPPHDLEVDVEETQKLIEDAPSEEQLVSLPEPQTHSQIVLDRLMNAEDKRLTPLLNTISQTAPTLLGPHAVKASKHSGEFKVRKRVRQKVLEYYSQVLWGEVGSSLDHVLLWWGSRPLGTQICHNFRNWLQTFQSTVKLPEVLKPAIVSLLDSLCCHVTSVSWDQNFRQALVTAGTQHSRHIVHDVAEGTYTGQLFSDLFSELVYLSNSCEGKNWTTADLEEVPIVEQIPILHRLDHSIHTVRLWVISRARQLSNPWNMEQFFRVTQSDINSCLQALTQLRFASQIDILNDDNSEHVEVCVKMRAKLVSEVKANHEKLQNMTLECVEILAAVCRTVSLANLHMMFPDPEYWRQRLPEMPQFASNYVEDYLDEVLRPVLLATTNLPLAVQQKVSGMVLHIMCEAWLDHIYAHQIKFSEWGALQLLTDFGAVPTWLLERVTISAELRKHLLHTEVLRRCEGVGRLLLRRPGEHIPMSLAPPRKKHDSDNEDGSPEMMPAEMYVPNQEQWLQLRAPRHTRAFTLCCGVPS